MRPQIVVWMVLHLAACRGMVAVTVGPEPDPVPASLAEFRIVGIDSAFALKARALADSAFASPKEEAESAALKQEGLALAALGTTFASPEMSFLAEPTGRDTSSTAAKEAAIRAFNDGAGVLEAYASEPDSVRAAVFLKEAETRFEAALRANPFDGEARFWLSRVYRIRAMALEEEDANDEAVRVLRQLFAMHQDRHDYAGLLAEALEWMANSEALSEAADLWLLAAAIAMDDALMSETPADSSAIMNYFARSSRASVGAGESVPALRALDFAEPWVSSDEERAFIGAEREWIQWDDGNLATRAAWDSLLALGDTDEEAAASGMEALLPKVARGAARAEVQHQLALLYHVLGHDDEAIGQLHGLWRELVDSGLDAGPEFSRLREDYGMLAFNLGQQRKRVGERVAALGYLLQSEQTGFSGAARAAFAVALLLNNNVEASLAAALRAEKVMHQLNDKEQRDLLRYLIELYRRSGDRITGERYFGKYRDL